jgi:thymidylate synthase
MTGRVEARSLSEAWAAGLEAVLDDVDQHVNHLLIRATQPLPEVPEIRAACDALLAHLKLQSVDTVRNTIFPYETAIDVPDPEELSAEYLEMYAALKRLGSERGTYFGRVVAYPRADGTTGNQLVETVTKLKAAHSGKRWTSTYELNIYNEQKDTNVTRSFPCMSHLAFHLDGERLDCLATYRSHDLIDKAYGNYLGLAQLQEYVAMQAGFVPGELAILAGRAFITTPKRTFPRLREIVASALAMS